MIGLIQFANRLPNETINPARSDLLGELDHHYVVRRTRPISPSQMWLKTELVIAQSTFPLNRNSQQQSSAALNSFSRFMKMYFLFFSTLFRRPPLHLWPDPCDAVAPWGVEGRTRLSIKDDACTLLPGNFNGFHYRFEKQFHENFEGKSLNPSP